jgi:hypothetical protein
MLQRGKHGSQLHSKFDYCVTQATSYLAAFRETIDKLLQSVSNIGLGSHTLLSTSKEPPPPLDPKDYPLVRFWTIKSFDAYCDEIRGETDGLATQQKRRGRRRKSEISEDRYPYLENRDGSVVPREVLIKVGQKARRVWQGLSDASIAPPSWGKATEAAYTYFNAEMLNDPEFTFFRYCEGNWKIKRWATKAYSSWAHNHLRLSDAGERAPRPAKRKLDQLDDPKLLQIEGDDEEIPITPSSDQSPIETNCDALASPVPSGSASTLIQVGSHRHKVVMLNTIRH